MEERNSSTGDKVGRVGNGTVLEVEQPLAVKPELVTAAVEGGAVAAGFERKNSVGEGVEGRDSIGGGVEGTDSAAE